MSSPVFDVINKISTDYEYKYEDGKAWFNSFLTVRFFSLFQDTILYADEVNHLGYNDRMVFDFLVGSVSKRKRFTKWPKKENEDSEKIAIIQNYYQINEMLAEKYARVLNDEEIETIRKRTLKYSIEKI